MVAAHLLHAGPVTSFNLMTRWLGARHQCENPGLRGVIANIACWARRENPGNLHWANKRGKFCTQRSVARLLPQPKELLLGISSYLSPTEVHQMAGGSYSSTIPDSFQTHRPRLEHLCLWTFWVGHLGEKPLESAIGLYSVSHPIISTSRKTRLKNPIACIKPCLHHILAV